MSTTIAHPEPTTAGGPPVRSVRSPRLIAGSLVAVLLLGGFAAKAWWPEPKTDVREGTTVVDADGMAARYGIDVTLVGTSAAGGLVDFRYQVVDPDKANPLVHDVDLLPKIIVEETGATLGLASLPHNHGVDLELGGQYFFLLANANNALRPGTLVTVVIGDARLEHIVVQG